MNTIDDEIARKIAQAAQSGELEQHIGPRLEALRINAKLQRVSFRGRSRGMVLATAATNGFSSLRSE